MSLQLGDTAPDFTAETTEGKINFYEFLGDHWGVIFSHPADYTPVCTTELGRTAALQKEFDKRGVKIIAVSVDPLDKHMGWKNDINTTQHVNVEFPIIADENRTVANLYGMIHPKALATALFVLYLLSVQIKNKVDAYLSCFYRKDFYRSIACIDSLQLTAKHSVLLLLTGSMKKM